MRPSRMLHADTDQGLAVFAIGIPQLRCRIAVPAAILIGSIPCQATALEVYDRCIGPLSL